MALFVSCGMDCVEKTFGYYQVWNNGNYSICLLEDNKGFLTMTAGAITIRYSFTPNCDSLGTALSYDHPLVFYPIEKLDNDHIKFGSAIYTRVQ